MKGVNRALLVVVTAMALACGGDGGRDNGAGGTPSADGILACEKHIDRYAQCEPDMTEEDIAAQKEKCIDPPDPEGLDIWRSWRPEFRAEFDRCYLDIIDIESDEVWNPDSPACGDLNDIDDICFPEALIAVRGEALDEQLMRTCIENSEACEQMVSAGLDNTSEVASCLTKWVECADQRADSDPYWTEDYCLFIVALTDENRRIADDCLDLACIEVAGCLFDAGAINF